MKPQQATIIFHTGAPCPPLKIPLDSSEAVPVFIMQGVFYVKAADKTTHYFPLCNVRAITVG
jgi:hypothetical protein